MAYIDNDLKNSTFGLYLKDIKDFKQLSREEEQTYFKKAQEGDLEAKKTLIYANLGLVISIALKLSGSSAYLIDLIQDGNIGLIDAIDKFDPSLGYKFSTYAYWYIRKEIVLGMENKNLIKLSRSHRERYYKFKNAKEHLEDLEEEITDDNLMKELNISKSTLKKLKEFDLYNNYLSLENEFTSTKGNKVTFGECIGNFTNDPESQYINKELNKKVKNAITNTLTAREKDIIKKRFGFDKEPMTLVEVGKEYNLTKERVRQIEIKAKKKIKKLTDLNTYYYD